MQAGVSLSPGPSAARAVGHAELRAETFCLLERLVRIGRSGAGGKRGLDRQAEAVDLV